MDSESLLNKNYNSSNPKSLFWYLAQISFFLFLFFIFFGTSAPFKADITEAEDLATSNPVRQLVFSVIYFLSLISLTPVWSKMFRIVKQEKFLAIFFLWTLLSIIWSGSPDVTFKRWIQIFGSYIVIISIFVHSESAEDILKFFRIILYIYIPISFISVFTIPDATMSYQGESAWRGLAAHKNGFGQISLVSSLFWFFSTQNKNSKLKWIYYSMFFISIILLVGSKSSTSIITLLIIGLLILFINIKEKFSFGGIGKWLLYLLGLFFVTTVIFAAILFPSVLESFFNLTGKDPTFTGRTDLWADVLTLVSKNIIWGVGYGAFWVPNTEQLNYLYQFYIWLPQQAHNGYIDIIIETGFIGLSIFASMLFAYFYRNSKWQTDNFWKYFIIAAIILNFQESSLFRTTSMVGILFTFSYLIQSFEIVNKRI